MVAAVLHRSSSRGQSEGPLTGSICAAPPPPRSHRTGVLTESQGGDSHVTPVNLQPDWLLSSRRVENGQQWPRLHVHIFPIRSLDHRKNLDICEDMHAVMGG